MNKPICLTVEWAFDLFNSLTTTEGINFKDFLKRNNILLVEEKDIDPNTLYWNWDEVVELESEREEEKYFLGGLD